MKVPPEGTDGAPVQLGLGAAAPKKGDAFRGWIKARLVALRPENASRITDVPSIFYQFLWCFIVFACFFFMVSTWISPELSMTSLHFERPFKDLPGEALVLPRGALSGHGALPATRDPDAGNACSMAFCTYIFI